MREVIRCTFIQGIVSMHTRTCKSLPRVAEIHVSLPVSPVLIVTAWLPVHECPVRTELLPAACAIIRSSLALPINCLPHHATLCIYAEVIHPESHPA